MLENLEEEMEKVFKLVENRLERKMLQNSVELVKEWK